MAKPRYLKNAPITEAIIDFRVTLPRDFQMTIFSSLKEELHHHRYPKVEEIQRLNIEPKIKDGKIFQREEQSEPYGYFFKTDDEKNIAQFRNDGFTFNRLKPYTQWREIISEAKKLWTLYVSKASPVSITRIAVRYINHLNIFQPIIDFSEYLEAPPKVPNNLPQNISSFLTKVTIHDLERGIAANLIQAFEKSEAYPNIIILDIDVYKQKEFDINNEEIWSVFEQLHEMKNQIFFNSITEKTVELFK